MPRQANDDDDDVTDLTGAAAGQGDKRNSEKKEMVFEVSEARGYVADIQL